MTGRLTIEQASGEVRRRLDKTRIGKPDLKCSVSSGTIWAALIIRQCALPLYYLADANLQGLNKCMLPQKYQLQRQGPG